MIVDARELSDGHRIEADIIIIGGGMAGISFAHEWIGKKTKIAILESGGMEPDDAVQDFYAGKATMKGPDNPDRPIDEYLTASRMRFYGGSGNTWGGKSVPLDPADFMARDWVGQDGWPFGRDDLQPYYDRACDRLAIPRFDKDFTKLQEEGRPPLNVNDAKYFTSLPRVHTLLTGAGDGDAFDIFKSAITDQPNIDVYLNVNVTEIVAKTDGGEVDYLALACLNGRKHRATGRVYILATGGIENARLLLASNSVNNAGLGNENDLVGRYFHGHLIYGAYQAAEGVNTSVIFSNTNQSMTLYSDRARDKVHCVLGASAAGQEHYKIANFTVTLINLWYEPQSQSKALNFLAGAVDQERATPADSQHYQCYFMAEQVPNSESRIRLGSEQDALGMPRVEMDWVFEGKDWDMLEKSVQAFRTELGIHHAGRVEWPMKRSEYLQNVDFARHHMGTTRMHTEPEKGVVDADCRMHSAQNLYIAGSSVFPTGGIANPTLTIIALVIRMADQLKQEFGEAA